MTEGVYLVTGAAGFIGSAVARALLQTGSRVAVIDNLSTGFRSSAPNGAHFVEGDVQDPAAIARLPQWPYSAVFHIAGQSSGEISFDDPVYDLRTNVESTLRLVEFSLDLECRRFIFASSMSVYGEQQRRRPVSETSIAKPTSFYGVGKLASENYLRIFAKRSLEPTSLRRFNVYGRGKTC